LTRRTLRRKLLGSTQGNVLSARRLIFDKMVDW
jgi:hypothetical protein